MSVYGNACVWVIERGELIVVLDAGVCPNPITKGSLWCKSGHNERASALAFG